MTAYVYGVVAAGADVPGVTGVGSAEVRLVAHDALAGLVSSVDADGLRVRRRDLRAHLTVLERAFARTTVAPCRFGTVFEDDEAVRQELLAPRASELAALLVRLEGRVQLALSVDHDEETLLRGVVAGDGEIAHLREATRDAGADAHAARVRLGELVASAVEARRRSDAGQVLAALAPVVETVDADETPWGHVLKASLLVPADVVPEVERRLEQLGAEAGGRLRFELVGPLPPTAFAELVDEEAAAWA
jgi:hypothetical protein